MRKSTLSVYQNAERLSFMVLRLFLGAVKHNQSLKSWQGFHPQMNYRIIKHGPPLFATYLHVQEAI